MEKNKEKVTEWSWFANDNGKSYHKAVKAWQTKVTLTIIGLLVVGISLAVLIF